MSTGDIFRDGSFEWADSQDGTSASGGSGLVTSFRLGERQESGPLAVYPIFLGEPDETGGHGGDYVTLAQAVRDGSVKITEITWLGSIPKVRVINRGEAPVLMLDGEELLGAKQNRVLATSILVERSSDLVVPVACTERGRWAYVSQAFADSGVMAERSVRHALRDSVNEGLRAGAGVYADQGRVWDEVDALHRRQTTWSSTAAMRDAYEGRRRELDKAIASFPAVEGQNGLLVLHGSRPVGLDVVSGPAHYKLLHEKLLRSYAFEALVRGGDAAGDEAAEQFLERIGRLQGKSFTTAGIGRHVGFEGEGIAGTALFDEGRLVHAGFFDASGASAQAQQPGRVSRVRGSRHEVSGEAPSAFARDLRKRMAREREDRRRAVALATYLESRPRLQLVEFDVPYGHMGATLADAVLQGGLRFERPTVPEANRLRNVYPTAQSTRAFDVLLESSDARMLLGWSDEGKVRTLKALVQTLLDENVQTEAELLGWLDDPGSRALLAGVEGVGEPMIQYLRFLAGAEDAAPVDRWLWRVLDAAKVRTYGVNDALGVYREAAAAMGVSLATLEYSLWRYGMARRWKP